LFGYNNYGKVEGDSVDILIKDEYESKLSYNKTIKRKIPLFDDSLAINVPIKGKPGEHTFSINIDPSNIIDEIIRTIIHYHINILLPALNIRNLALTNTCQSNTGKY